MADLSWKQKALIGGSGALAPSVVALATIDLGLTLQSPSRAVYLGLAVRVAALFVLGAAVAAFHTSENTPFKLFELGIAAPAMITTALVGGKVEARHSAVLPFLNPPAVYASSRQLAAVECDPSIADQFFRGLFGGGPQQYLLISFPESREVRVDGVAMGQTNEVLQVSRGGHTVTLAPPYDFLPEKQTVDVERACSSIDPKRIIFERRSTREVSPQPRAPRILSAEPAQAVDAYKKVKVADATIILKGGGVVMYFGATSLDPKCDLSGSKSAELSVTLIDRKGQALNRKPEKVAVAAVSQGGQQEYTTVPVPFHLQQFLEEADHFAISLDWPTGRPSCK